MFTVELYARIRRGGMVNGLSRRDLATHPISAGLDGGREWPSAY